MVTTKLPDRISCGQIHYERAEDPSESLEEVHILQWCAQLRSQLWIRQVQVSGLIEINSDLNKL